MHQENFGIGFTLICSEQQISYHISHQFFLLYELKKE